MLHELVHLENSSRQEHSAELLERAQPTQTFLGKAKRAASKSTLSCLHPPSRLAPPKMMEEPEQRNEPIMKDLNLSLSVKNSKLNVETFKCWKLERILPPGPRGCSDHVNVQNVLSDISLLYELISGRSMSRSPC
jgi:hypothetical protein